MDVRICPKCDLVCARGDRTCPDCGASLVPRFGVRPRPREEEDERPGTVQYLMVPLELFPGLVRVKVLIMCAVAVPIAAGLASLTLLMMVLGLMWLAFMAGGVAMVVYWSALGWLMAGEVCGPSEALADFTGLQWIIFILLGGAPVYVGLALLGAGG